MDINVPEVSSTLSIMQDDNATPHRCRAVNAFIRQAGITRMPWPANSPDFNPIENVWGELGRRVQQHQPPLATRQELLQILQQEWANLLRAFIATTNTMRPQCLDCIARRGGYSTPVIERTVMDTNSWIFLLRGTVVPSDKLSKFVTSSFCKCIEFVNK